MADYSRSTQSGTGTHGFLVMYAETSFAEQQTPSVWRPEMLFFFFYGSLL